MKILNYTPHRVVVIVSAEEVRVFESVGVARVQQTNQPCGDIDGVPVFRAEYGAVEGLPEPAEGTWYIVSSIVKAALPERKDLLVPVEFLRDESGNIRGCRGFTI